MKQRREKVLLERAVKRRRHSLQRQRWPPNRVRPSRRVALLSHWIHCIGSLFHLYQRLSTVLHTRLQQNHPVDPFASVLPERNASPLPTTGTLHRIPYNWSFLDTWGTDPREIFQLFQSATRVALATGTFGKLPTREGCYATLQRARGRGSGEPNKTLTLKPNKKPNAGTCKT